MFENISPTEVAVLIPIAAVALVAVGIAEVIGILPRWRQAHGMPPYLTREDYNINYWPGYP